MTDDKLDGHELFVCDGEGCRDSSTCMWCDGGLSACTLCGASEGGWPDQCPGAPMTREQSDAVYGGRLNYRDGAWREGECCQVMRLTHDTDAFMAEHGYRRDAAGRWERVAPH